MSENHEEPRLMAQWIVSLAVSVVCCAVLFIVFAGYIVDLHDASTLTAVRLEVTQEKLTHVSNDLEQLRRSLQPTPAPQKIAAPEKTDQQPAAETPAAQPSEAAPATAPVPSSVVAPVATPQSQTSKP